MSKNLHIFSTFCRENSEENMEILHSVVPVLLPCRASQMCLLTERVGLDLFALFLGYGCESSFILWPECGKAMLCSDLLLSASGQTYPLLCHCLVTVVAAGAGCFSCCLIPPREKEKTILSLPPCLLMQINGIFPLSPDYLQTNEAIQN